MADDDFPKRRGCGTMQVHRRLLDTDRDYARRLARIEDHAFRAAMAGPAMRPGCTRIPVVVHVVYRTQAQNISQAQIDSQIAVLNRDFRKKNPDISNVPAPFAPLAGDARIEFELATVDPDGNPTDGVTRTETTRTSFGSGDEVKFDAQGGKDAWPSDTYLNIWVCQLSGGLLGYAQFPGGPAATDGVVVTHTGFGTTGTAAAPFDKGRTTTHEIGHWLNLRHIWGDDGNGCSGSDFVADTPNQGGPNTGKPSFPSVSCGNGPNGDMFMNYMDYVDDDTMVMFSEGQITRMQACLDGPRSAIGTAIPCDGGGQPPKPLPKDLPQDPPKHPPKDFPKDLGKDFPKDPPKELPKDPPKDFPKDPPKEFPKEFPKDGPKEFPKDPGKDGPKDFPFDPGPKSIIDDLPKFLVGDLPKTIPGDIPGKGIKDPPKSFLEPPFEPGGPGLPQPPTLPGFPGLPGVPFVMGTGAPPAQPQAQPPVQPQAQPPAMDMRAQYLGYYAQILQQYAALNQRGMLDAQGHAAWQQAWSAYQQLGGS